MARNNEYFLSRLKIFPKEGEYPILSISSSIIENVQFLLFRKALCYLINQYIDCENSCQSKLKQCRWMTKLNHFHLAWLVSVNEGLKGLASFKSFLFLPWKGQSNKIIFILPDYCPWGKGRKGVSVVTYIGHSASTS